MPHKHDKAHNPKLKIQRIPNQVGKGSDDPKKILGYDMFQTLYSNIFCLAPKNSGKTTTIYNILKKCANKNSFVVFFVSTIYNDSSYEAILKDLDNRGIKYELHTSLFEMDGTNILQNYVEELEAEAKRKREEPEEQPPPPPPRTMCNFGYKPPEPQEPTKPKKPKKLAPEIFFVFDDLGHELRNKWVEAFLKRNRHFNAKSIMSSQYYRDITPGAWANLDYALLFGGLDLDKLKAVREEMGINDTLEDFASKYVEATEKPYSFLYYDSKRHKYRMNFDTPL